ncbi:MAG: hypothetical protein IKW30_00505 [Lachnospiraceae bacterium]|nr:hypothetical protein [Lachnospiraceae bacterium]
MKTLIELCNADLNKATFKNVMFFSLAETGAMGDPGSIVFYVKTGESYYLNYMYGDIDMQKVLNLFPVLANCKFGILGLESTVPKGWKYLYLGAGNHLIINEEVWRVFKKQIDVSTEPSEIYCRWMEVANYLLQEK